MMFTTLILATQYGHLGVMRALINVGAPINTESKNGSTALIDAVESDQLGFGCQPGCSEKQWRNHPSHRGSHAQHLVKAGSDG